MPRSRGPCWPAQPTETRRGVSVVAPLSQAAGARGGQLGPGRLENAPPSWGQFERLERAGGAASIGTSQRCAQEIRHSTPRAAPAARRTGEPRRGDRSSECCRATPAPGNRVARADAAPRAPWGGLTRASSSANARHADASPSAISARVWLSAMARRQGSRSRVARRRPARRRPKAASGRSSLGQVQARGPRREADDACSPAPGDGRVSRARSWAASNSPRSMRTGRSRHTRDAAGGCEASSLCRARPGIGQGVRDASLLVQRPRADSPAMMRSSSEPGSLATRDRVAHLDLAPVEVATNNSVEVEKPPVVGGVGIE